MTLPSTAHLPCTMFNAIREELAPDTLHRFILGRDTAPVPMTGAGATANLGDAFATELLLRGSFPRTAGEVLTGLSALAGRSDAINRHRFFVLGEGSQIEFTTQTEGLARGLRFLVACGHGRPDGPDILISSFHPDRGDVELMAWDHRAGGFNYYRTVGANRAWIFAGNSQQAFEAETAHNGPFESHPSGNLVMKELRAPWVNWDSPDASIPASVFGPGDLLASHPWFTTREAQGAFTCETDVARPSIVRWTRVHFDSMVASGEDLDTRRIMAQILDTATVNIVSSFARGDGSAETQQDPVDLPSTFFADIDALIGDDEESGVHGVGIEATVPTFTVPRAVYEDVLRKLDVRLESTHNGATVFSKPGDTHFAFVVPERAFEDHRAMCEARRIGLVTDRLAACLLMVDFTNPIYSTRRARLLDHVPQRANLTLKDFEQSFADTILAAATSTSSPEREFADLWNVGENWRAQFGLRLRAYFEAIARAIQTSDGFEPIYRLAETRRQHMREKTALVESSLLFPTSSVPSGNREMRPDGSVIESDAGEP